MRGCGGSWGLLPAFRRCAQGVKIHTPLHSSTQIDGRSEKCTAVHGWAGPPLEFGDRDPLDSLGEWVDDPPANPQEEFGDLDPVALLGELDDWDPLDPLGQHDGDLVGLLNLMPGILLECDPDEGDGLGIVSPVGERVVIQLVGLATHLTAKTFLHQS